MNFFHLHDFFFIKKWTYITQKTGSKQMTKKILVVVTNVGKYPNAKRATGLWLGEVSHFVDAVEKAGIHVDYVSPKGGYTPIDPHSLSPEMCAEDELAFYNDNTKMTRLGITLSPNQITASDYAAIYYSGGHGVMWDFPENKELRKIAETIAMNGGIVSAVCHGVVGLLELTNPDGTPFIKGKKVTGFSNSEEEAVQLTKLVPFLTQSAMEKKGANFEKAADWAPHVVVDGNLITGQNPASAGAVAKKVLEELKK